MSECIFCKIVSGDIPSAKLLEDENSLAFLDVNPINPGHALLIPKKHYETLMEVPGEELAPLMTNLPLLARAVVAAANAEGLNIFQTNNECAGQVVPHVHFHIIPRHSTDGFRFGWRQGTYTEGEFDEMRERIAAELGG